MNVCEYGLPVFDNLLLTKYDFLISTLEGSSLNCNALVAALRLVRNLNKTIKVILV